MRSLGLILLFAALSCFPAQLFALIDKILKDGEIHKRVSGSPHAMLRGKVGSPDSFTTFQFIKLFKGVSRSDETGVAGFA